MWLVSQNTKVPLQSFKTKHEAHAWGRERLHGWFMVWREKGRLEAERGSQGAGKMGQGARKMGQGAGLKDHGPGPKGFGDVTKV